MFPVHCAICDKEELGLFDLGLHISKNHIVAQKNDAAVPKVAKKRLSEPLTHTTGSPRTSCPHCRKTYANPHQVRRHIRNQHLGIKPFQCPHCSKCFAEKSKMLRHATRHAEPAAVNGHDDDVCEVSTDFASIDDDVEMAAPEQDIPALPNLPKSIADKFGKGLTIVRTASARMPRAMPVTADKVDEINSNRKPALRQSM